MKNLRVLLLGILLLTGLQSKASHIIGSYYQFEFVSADTIANTKTYRVSLYLYRDPQGVTLPGLYTIYYQKNPVNASNWSTTNVTQDSTWTDSIGCGSTGIVEVYRYSNTITTDWNGAYSVMFSSCCRSNMINNLGTAASAGHNAVATLVVGKPVRGYNSSPMANFSPKSIPVGTNATFSISAADPDGDSLSYNIVPCREGSNTNYSDIVFSPGYSTTAPFGPSGSLSLDTANGTITVQSSIQQVCAVNIEIIEWAKDTAGVWRIMGKSEHDHLYHFTAPTTPVGTANLLSAGTPNDLPSDSLWVSLDFPVYSSMIDLDSVQFQLYNSNQQAYVVSASTPNGPYQLLLRTDAPLNAGNWSLYIGYSLDSIALHGSCGAVLEDTADFRVEVPVSQIAFGGPDSAYVTTQLDYFFTSGMEWVDSVHYTVLIQLLS